MGARATEGGEPLRRARLTHMATEATESGAATLAELHVQGEQLKKIRKDQEMIDQNLKTSDRLLVGLDLGSQLPVSHVW